MKSVIGLFLIVLVILTLLSVMTKQLIGTAICLTALLLWGNYKLNKSEGESDESRK